MICDMINDDDKNNCQKQIKSGVRLKYINVGDTHVSPNDDAKMNDEGPVYKSTYSEVTREKVSKKLTTHKLFQS